MKSSTGQVKVSFRIDSDANLHSTDYYLGSNGLAIKHDNVAPDGPLTVTFQIPTDIPDPNNHVNPTTIYLPTDGSYGIEFEIIGYADGTFANCRSLNYQLTFGGPPTTPVYNGHTYAFISFNGTPQSWSKPTTQLLLWAAIWRPSPAKVRTTSS